MHFYKGLDHCQEVFLILSVFVFVLLHGFVSSNDDYYGGIREVYGPGGWGAFTSLTRSNKNASVWLSGADVGGLYISVNDGKTWTTCNYAMNTLWVMSIVFTTHGMPFVGTSAGVYVGRDAGAPSLLNSKQKQQAFFCGPWKIEPLNTGFRSCNITAAAASSGFIFAHPVRCLTSNLDPDGKEIVYAGIGIQKNLGYNDRNREGDPYHVYSLNISSLEYSNPSWQPLLAISESGDVYSISAEPRNGHVFVATSHGLYASYDYGNSWSNNCNGNLPTSTTSLKPNLRKVVSKNNHLWVSVWDSQVAVVNNDTCQVDKPDPLLRHFIGGPWYSNDFGMNWKYLLLRENDSMPLWNGAFIRCPNVSDHYAGSQLPQFDVQLQHNGMAHLFIGGWGKSEGLHELIQNEQLVTWTTCGDGSYGCYEGQRPDIYQKDNNTYVYDFHVQWNSNETRDIVNGKVLGGNFASFLEQRPLVWYTTSRGGHRVAWSPIQSVYTFKHFTNDIVDMHSFPVPTWSSTGMGDTCVWDTVWLDENTLIMAVADGGVVRTKDNGLTWQKISDNWLLDSQGTAIMTMRHTNVIYVGHFDRGATSLSTVLVSLDGGDFWTIVGGYDPTNSTSKTDSMALGVGQIKRITWVSSLSILVISGTSGTYEAKVPLQPEYLTWVASPLTSNNISCAVTSYSAGPTFVSSAGLVLFGCEDGLHIMDMKEPLKNRKMIPLSIVMISNNGFFSMAESEIITAMSIWSTTKDINYVTSEELVNFRIVIGVRGTYSTHDGIVGPVLLYGNCSINVQNLINSTCLLNVSNQTSLSAASSRMSISAIFYNSLTGNVYAGLTVGDYFDGYVPPGLFVSDDNGTSFVLLINGFQSTTPLLSNTLVANIGIDFHNRVCVSTIGNALQCLPSGSGFLKFRHNA